MIAGADHTYTQLLVISVLAYATKDASWWTLPALIVICSTLAIIAEALKKTLFGGRIQ